MFALIIAGTKWSIPDPPVDNGGLYMTSLLVGIWRPAVGI
jgi:hypothetical protein